MRRIGATLRGLRDGHLGFFVDEVMSGDHEFEPGCGPEGRQPLTFTVTWGRERTTPWEQVKRDRLVTLDLRGSVTVGGLCEQALCAGTLELRYFVDRKIRYTFEFEERGQRYRFVGEKVNILPWNLPVSHTTCYGVLTEAESGRLVSRSVSFFRLRTLPRFLASFRVVEPATE
jgi:hypothetical protein